MFLKKSIVNPNFHQQTCQSKRDTFRAPTIASVSQVMSIFLPELMLRFQILEKYRAVKTNNEIFAVLAAKLFLLAHKMHISLKQQSRIK